MVHLDEDGRVTRVTGVFGLGDETPACLLLWGSNAIGNGSIQGMCAGAVTRAIKGAKRVIVIDPRRVGAAREAASRISPATQMSARSRCAACAVGCPRTHGVARDGRRRQQRRTWWIPTTAPANRRAFPCAQRFPQPPHCAETRTPAGGIGPSRADGRCYRRGKRARRVARDL